jgi:hypothetical protein
MTFSPTPIRNTGKMRKRGGCLGLGVVIFGIVALFLLVNPWATHIGDRPTPALIWHGVGMIKSTSGADSALYLEVWPDPGGSGYRSANLSGSAWLCTPQKMRYNFRVNGYLRHAWLDTDGKSMQLLFFSPKNAQQRLNFELIGTWRKQELLLDDKGTMAMSFHPDGSAKGYLIGANSPKEVTQGVLHYAPQSEFDSACPGSGTTF